ncbi:MAG: GNAT family N-acetyltransferase [Planctomycetota bacterium]
MRIVPVPVDLILPLRHRILRPGLPLDTARFPGDADPATLHLAAYQDDSSSPGGADVSPVDPPEPTSAPSRDSSLLGCVSIYAAPDPTPGSDRRYQLRGMAVDDGQRGRGIGAALLADVHRRYPPHTLWCNARTIAERFYQSLGWQTVSDVFDIPTVGPHVVMHGP